jgi:hypothetical protein
MRKLLYSAVIVCTALQLQAQAPVKGYVFNDANGNGKRERSEKGIPGVSVTNGVQVVQTDDNGAYTLVATNDQIISVIKPSGYAIPVNARKLPQFFYIHKPSGSPKSEFKGVDPTGALPSSVDFPLAKSAEQDDFKMLVFGDPQPYTLEEVGYFDKAVVEEVAGIKGIAFGLSMGDLVGNDLSLFNPYIEAVKRVGLPWYNLMGNHDLNFDAPADSLSDETYEAHFGPANYAFNYGKVHFIVLDDVLYPDPRGRKGYWGGFRKDQLEFVENDLKFVPEDHLIVLAFHIPISELKDGGDAFRDADREKLFDILKRFPNTLSMSAHTHNQRQDFLVAADGWKRDKPHHHYNVGTTSGNWYSGELNDKGIPVSTMSDGTPKGYAFVSFKGNQYTLDYKVVDKPASYQIEITAPNLLEYKKKSSASIYANFFMGSEKDTVHYRIGNGKWKPMTYVLDYAPDFTNVLYKWDNTEQLLTGRRPSNPNRCTHLWRAPVNTDLPAGEHTIEVKAKDMFGREFIQKGSYKIAAAN